MTCDECRELIELYAADALDQPQCGQVRAHLAEGCPSCNAAVVEATLAATHLALALEPRTPPASARRELMRRIGRVPQSGTGKESPATGATPPPGIIAPAVDETVGGGQGEVPIVARLGGRGDLDASGAPRQRGLRRWRRWRLAVVAAAMAILLGGALIGMHAAVTAYQQMESELAESRQQMEQLQERIVEQQRVEPTGEWWRRLSEVFRLLRQPDLQMALMQTPQPDALSGDLPAGRVFWDPEESVVHLLVSHLMPSTEDEPFYVWLQTRDDRTLPAGTFNTDERGDGAFFGRSPAVFDEVTHVFVTREQHRPDRTQEHVLLAVLDQ